MNQLKSDEYPAIFEPYIQTITGDGQEELETQLAEFSDFIDSIPEEKGTYSYSEEKWTVKQILCHILDFERIMSYRALRFARNDMTALAPFEQEEFVKNNRSDERTLESIKEEFKAIRKSNILFFNSLNEKELTRKGMASDRLISVRAIIYIIVGHLNHHRIILQERYLKPNE